MKLIEIIISPTGETQLQTQGFQGSACQAASRALEQALGLITHEERTAEFYHATTLEQQRLAQR